MEIAERISTKEGTLVYLNETDERYLKGLYYINETNTPYRILSDNGSENTIDAIFNKFQLIDNYSVNNKVISTEGGITINADDISVDDITIANQGYGKMGVVNTIPENKPTVEKSIEILQNNIAALTIAMSASLNEFNTLIQEMRKDIEKLKGTE